MFGMFGFGGGYMGIIIFLTSHDHLCNCDKVVTVYKHVHTNTI